MHQYDNIVEFIFLILGSLIIIYSINNVTILGMILIFFVRMKLKTFLKTKIVIKYRRGIYLKLVCVLFWCILLVTMYLNLLNGSLVLIVICFLAEFLVSSIIRR